MEALIYLLNFVFDAFIMLLILRVWMQLVRADFYNPFSQFVVKATSPLVVPFRRVIPGFAGIDLATLLIAYAVACLKIYVFFLLGIYAMDPVASFLIGLILLAKTMGAVLMYVMIAMALMSWVVQGGSPIQLVFHQLTEPVLRPIRRIMPDLGGIDLSVAIAIFVLIFLSKLISGAIPYWAIL
ncbi:YggT family protein [Thalassotalea crassostreae]|uniref:YggT family protein n=1 Tax=Thalassotalea crassostreae TaxID=1763536 RepID=UPI0008386D5B|nr:YggT family protein [Thalassotalea crassostreae]